MGEGFWGEQCWGLNEALTCNCNDAPSNHVSPTCNESISLSSDKWRITDRVQTFRLVTRSSAAACLLNGVELWTAAISALTQCFNNVNYDRVALADFPSLSTDLLPCCFPPVPSFFPPTAGNAWNVLKFLTNAFSCSLLVSLPPLTLPPSRLRSLTALICPRIALFEQHFSWSLFCVSLSSLSSSSLSQGSANAAVLDVSQSGGHKKRVRRSSFLNAKKLYEDAQMARKVKQYLSKLSLETNEESLQTLSMQCEPSISTRKFKQKWWRCSPGTKVRKSKKKKKVRQTLILHFYLAWAASSFVASFVSWGNRKCLTTFSLLSAQERRRETTRHFASCFQSCQPAEGPAGQRKPGAASSCCGSVPITQESSSQRSATIWYDAATSPRPRLFKIYRGIPRVKHFVDVKSPNQKENNRKQLLFSLLMWKNCIFCSLLIRDDF